METPMIKEVHFREADVLEELLEGAAEGAQRRNFLKKGSMAAAAMALAGSWFATVQKSKAQSGMSDIDMLKAAFTLEQKAVNTYTAAAGIDDPSNPGMKLVSGDVLSVALAFRGDHAAHATFFKDVLVELGSSAPSDSSDNTLAEFPPGPNSQLSSLPGILRYALAVEIFAAKLWYTNFKSASDLRVKRVFADLAPNEAAHAAILRAALKFVASQPTDHDNADPGKAVVPYTQLSFDSAVF